MDPRDPMAHSVHTRRQTINKLLPFVRSWGCGVSFGISRYSRPISASPSYLRAHWQWHHRQTIAEPTRP